MRLLFSCRKTYYELFRFFSVNRLRNVYSFGLYGNGAETLCGFRELSSFPHYFKVQTYSQQASPHEDSENCIIAESAATDIEDSDFNKLTNGDPLLEKKLKILMLEVEVLRQSGARVPQKIKFDQWKELLPLETRSKRRKYLDYLFVVEKKKESTKEKKRRLKELREKMETERVEVEDDHILYGLHRNTLFLRIYDATITEFHNRKLIQAMLFSQNLVVDCSYDTHMTKQEAENCGKQIMLLFSDNRIHDNPFNLYLCNANRESVTMRHLSKFIPTMYNCDFPLNITNNSYLNMFSKEKIVYLTPHCKEVLKEFDHDAVYVIGAMVDKSNNEPLSLAKAKREGLKMAKLPLDNYLLWGTGRSKSLTLNQVIRILLDLRISGDWNKALQHVPQRKTARIDGDSDSEGNRRKTLKMFKFKTRHSNIKM